MKSLEEAIGIAGGQSALAEMIGVVPQVVNNWIRRGKVPADHCPNIERATDGRIRCEDLRPDVNWAVLRCVPVLPPETLSDAFDPRSGVERRDDDCRHDCGETKAAA